MYNVTINKKIVAFGLSRGELNQWLIDIYKELSNKDKIIFLKDFEFDVDLDNLDFIENLIYELETITIKMKCNSMEITETEF